MNSQYKFNNTYNGQTEQKGQAGSFSVNMKENPHFTVSLCCMPFAPCLYTLLFLDGERSWLKTALRVPRMGILYIMTVTEWTVVEEIRKQAAQQWQ